MALAADDPEAQARIDAFRQRTAATGLDRRPQCADRVSLGCRRTPTTFASMRRNWSRSRRTSSWLPARARHAPLLQATRTIPIVFVTSPIRSAPASSKPGAAGRQRHRLHAVRIRHEREMAGTAQGDRARRDARGGASGSRPYRPGLASSPRSRPWRRRLGWRCARSTCATPPRSSAPSRRSRASEWRPDRDAERVGAVHRDLIIALAATARLPAVYSFRFFVAGGGLISYGPDLGRSVPARGRLCRPHPQGREARRPAGAGADQVRAGDQSQDREGARPHRAADAARPRRRGDRMRRVRCRLLAQSGHAAFAARCPLLGVKRTWRINEYTP